MKLNTKKLVEFLVPFLILVFWFFLTEFGLVNTLYLPSPFNVLTAVSNIGFEKILLHSYSTLARILIGFIIGSLLGILIGILMMYNETIFSLLNGVIQTSRPIPPIAVIPFFLLWFGFNPLGKILLIVLGTALILVINTIEAIKNVNPKFIQAAYSLGASKTKVFRTIVFPAIIPELKSGLRIALALSISLTIASEFLGAQEGIGYLINVAKVTFSTHTILLGIFILGIMSYCLDLTLQKLLDYFSAWTETSTESLNL